MILTYNSNPASADAVVEEIEADGGRAVAFKLDVADRSSFPALRDAVSAALETTWKRADFDGLVNNAGFGLYNAIATVTEAEFDSLFSVHLKGPFFLAQARLPLMVDGGHIVNMSSATARVATAGVAPCASFKGGLEVLTRHRPRSSASVAFGPIRLRPGRSAPTLAVD